MSKVSIITVAQSLRLSTFLCLLLLLTACNGGGGGGGGGGAVSGTDPSIVARTSVIAPGDVDCTYGGVLVETGIDENSNGVLDASEIDASEKVCNGAPGTDGVNALVITSNEPTGANCASGGLRIDSGLDANSNDVLEPGEITTTDYVCSGASGASGTDGSNSLIATADEAPGANCTYGGVQITSGVDDNNNNVLDPAEVDATAYICDGAGSTAQANGYPVTDAWGEVWDGVTRPKATYAEAAASCSGLGGRLPIATELYRNNLITGYSESSISSPSETEYLWTQIPIHLAAYRVIVRLTDGLISNSTEATEQYYRCVWPDNSPTSFDANACNGNPGAACWDFDGRQNLDSTDRPAMTYASAAAECSFSHASIPSISDWGQMIHADAPNGRDRWLWASNVFSGNVDIVKWFGANVSWPNNGISVSSAQPLRNFRCVGDADSSLLQAPISPVCDGGCFSIENRRSPLQADSQDRVAMTHPAAVEACAAIGGELPSPSEFSELVHEGWPNGTNTWVWTAEPHSYTFMAVARWAGAGVESWTWGVGGNFSRLSVSATANVRCVWRSSIADLPSCSGSDAINRTGNTYTCVTTSDGDSAGGAVPGGASLVDAWGNDWDLQQRVGSTYADASAACKSLSGRLPTASELYAVRFNQALSPAIGDGTATSYLWTKTTSSVSGSHFLARVSDGVTLNQSDTSLNPYRCVWPNTKGNVLSARACYGSCFEPDNKTRADSHDRPALPVYSAIEECKAVGGYIPDVGQMTKLIHQGWDNGTNVWLWMNQQTGLSSGDFALAKWTGAGATSWVYSSTGSGNYSNIALSRPFRCVYSSEAK